MSINACGLKGPISWFDWGNLRKWEVSVPGQFNIIWQQETAPVPSVVPHRNAAVMGSWLLTWQVGETDSVIGFVIFHVANRPRAIYWYILCTYGQCWSQPNSLVPKFSGWENSKEHLERNGCFGNILCHLCILGEYEKDQDKEPKLGAVRQISEAKHFWKPLRGECQVLRPLFDPLGFSRLVQTFFLCVRSKIPKRVLGFMF